MIQKENHMALLYFPFRHMEHPNDMDHDFYARDSAQ